MASGNSGRETRERLARLETRQETLESKTDDLREGQEEILDKIDTRLPDSGDLEDVEEDIAAEVQVLKKIAKKNRRARQRVKTATKLFVVLSSVTGTAAGVAAIL